MSKYPERMLQRANIRLAVQFAIITSLGYLAGYYFTSLVSPATATLGGMWAAISGILVFQGSTDETRASAILRLRGTVVGALVSAAYLLIFPPNPIGTAIAVAVAVLICIAIGLENTMRLAAVTVLIIIVVSSTNPNIEPILNALLRVLESALGAGIAVATALLWPKSRPA